MSAINTINVARTDAEVAKLLVHGDLGLNVICDDDRVRFETTQPDARVSDLRVGDQVIINGMGTAGALGEGSTYDGAIVEIDLEMGVAWIAKPSDEA
jgi:hypothetical protein